MDSGCRRRKARSRTRSRSPQKRSSYLYQSSSRHSDYDRKLNRYHEKKSHHRERDRHRINPHEDEDSTNYCGHSHGRVSRRRSDDIDYRRRRQAEPEMSSIGRETSDSVMSHKQFVDKMFFQPYDIIAKGSSQYDDFWKFYEKIEALRKQKAQKVRSSGVKEEADKNYTVDIRGISVPERYSKKYCVSFQLKYTEAEDYITRLNPEDQAYVRESVPMELIENFLQTLLYFLDFSQKERFSKLKKLRETQAALPIAHFQNEMLSILEKHNVLIIAGDTGCGKSTQVPQFLMKAGYTNIACTQPRRIACLSLCKRVAYETLNEYGTEIGYQIRFEKRKTQHTRVVFITEGLLLRQVTSDSLLTSYNVVVLDEVHERHLHGDFLLGIVKCLLYQRSDVKIILMSATINTELFQNYFQGLAPILQVPGRLFPIKMQYRPVSIEELNSKSGRLNPGPYVRILQLIDDKFPADERGDVLIFLSGLNEITTVVEAAQLYAEQTKRWIILPLHSMLSIDDQDKAFDYPPEGIRKCIVSTNIAETSITIDGIRFVVDSGKVKEMAYDPSCKMQRLKEFWISKASAEQRKGRAGRTGPGVCYRLYSEKEYDEMQSYSTPEILRVPLDSLLLQMISIGIPDCRKFPFIEPPALENVETSILRLKEQNALTESEQLTEMGKTLSQLPVDVTIGKMLIMGTLFDQIDAVLSLAAALSVQNPFTNWAHRDPDCVAARKSLDSDHGDPLTLLNAYRAWLEEKADPSSQTKKWCKRRGFEEQRFYEMTKLRQQFKSLLLDSKLISDRKEMAEMSSSERSMRHGELKHLRSLKKEFHMAAPRKKKILKLEDGVDAGDLSGAEDATDGNIDIRDVEFRLRNDHKQVKDLLRQSTAYGHEDLMMLKVILCSGIYPQLGVPDDFNKFKGDSEQVYHTRGKGFTVLHPMGIFANQADVLRLNDSDVIIVPHLSTKLPVSSKHQLVCFLNLLETNKPYLMNTFRMPAIQTLLLFGHSIDTDPTFTRFVFDSWLEVEFADSASARSLCITAMELRETWLKLLDKRLTQKDEPITPGERREGRQLCTGLVSFLRSETFYTLKRLLAADQKDLYNRGYVPDLEKMGDTEGLELEHNSRKGGVSLTPYLTYGCLYGELPEDELWECPICELSVTGSPLELLSHQILCKRSSKLKEQEHAAKEDEGEVNAKPFSKLFVCPVCQFTKQLTPIEILRHRQEHKN